jgi:hypothetical protein
MRMIVSGSSNKEMLTVRNFPIQATGAENKIKIVAPVHDR